DILGRERQQASYSGPRQDAGRYVIWSGTRSLGGLPVLLGPTGDDQEDVLGYQLVDLCDRLGTKGHRDLIESVKNRHEPPRLEQPICYRSLDTHTFRGVRRTRGLLDVRVLFDQPPRNPTEQCGRRPGFITRIPVSY